MNRTTRLFRAPAALVVDPDQSFRILAALVLRAEGCRVLSAATPAEALRLVRQDPVAVDLLLIDVNFSPPGGADPAGELRARWPGLAAVYTCRHAGDTPADRGELPADAPFLFKPNCLDGVCELVRQWYRDREEAAYDRLGVCPFSR